MSISLLRRIERLENPTIDPADLCNGLAIRLALARKRGEVSNKENEIERYHRIKFSDDPAKKEESARLRRLYWPRLNHR